MSETSFAAPFADGADLTLNELRCRIDRALQSLSYRERGILEMRFGLGDGYAYTLAEAGIVFQLTRERIRQIQVKAIKKLHRQGDALRSFLGRLNS
jgi:RNA polymerase primary sigma factor